MKDCSVSVCMSIHNQAPIITSIVNGIIKNISKNVKEIIFVFDGCDDGSDTIVKSIMNGCKVPTQYIYADDIWEVKANNLTFKNATCPYILTIQDDMLLLEKDFDKRIMLPFFKVENLLGVSARNAQDQRIENGELSFYNLFGHDVDSPRDILGVREIIIRGPIMYDHQKLEAMNYLDEEFAPTYGDDHDISFRAHREHGWIVGAFMVGYDSPLLWGKTRQSRPIRNAIWDKSRIKNIKMIIERHADLINGEKHTQDIIIKESL